MWCEWFWLHSATSAVRHPTYPLHPSGWEPTRGYNFASPRIDRRQTVQMTAHRPLQVTRWRLPGSEERQRFQDPMRAVCKARDTKSIWLPNLRNDNTRSGGWVKTGWRNRTIAQKAGGHENEATWREILGRNQPPEKLGPRKRKKMKDIVWQQKTRRGLWVEKSYRWWKVFLKPYQ